MSFHSLKDQQPPLSSSSSSPLLSLVQVPAKLAINLSIHTQHTYDNGVDRTGDRVFRKIQLLHEEREEEKKILTPRLCSIWSTVWEQKKNTSAQKHIYHKHMTLQQGEHIQLWQAAIRSSAIYFGAGRRPARPSGGAKRYRGSWMGEGSNVCSRGREGESPTPSFSQGGYPDGLGQGAGTGSQKR